MKRMTMIMLAIVMLSFSGCGEQEPEKEKEEVLKELEETEILQAVENLGETSEPEDTDLIESKEQEYNFEPTEEILQAEFEDGKIQLGDVVVTHLMKLSDFMTIIESSSIEYTYEYNPDKLITAKSNETMDFFSGEEQAFYISVYNFTDETISASDMAVVYIRPNAKEESPIYDCVYYAKGFGLNGSNVPAYAELKKYMEDNWGTVSEKSKNNIITIQTGEKVLWTNSIVDWQNTKVEGSSYWISCHIDANTGICTGVEMLPSLGFSYGPVK